MNSLADDDILSDFVSESREHLSAIEPDLLALEQQGVSAGAEVINRVFRAIHSIKGGAGFFSFERLKQLSHAMESALMLVRDGVMALTPALTDVVLASLDRLRAMLDDIGASDSVPCKAELEALGLILAEGGPPTGSPVEGAIGSQPVVELDAEAIRSSLRRGMAIYRATAWLRRDLGGQGLTPISFLRSALAVGTVLQAHVDPATLVELERSLDSDVRITLILGTVLEADLAAEALSLPVGQVEALDMERLRRQVDETLEAAADTPAPDPAQRSSKETVREATTSETLRVKVELLTSLMNLAGELVLSRNQLLRALDGQARNVPGLGPILQNLNQVTTEIQEGIMQTRMQPIGTVFGRFPRVVRDMSRKLGKQIDVQIRGAEVELDKSIVELLSDPLTHIIRNCADHAIEPPLARKLAGKDPTGTIQLRAFHEGGQVNIEVTDDGRGIDAAKVGAKAVEKGVITEAQLAAMSEQELVSLIFAPGFSTAETVSEVSGRGVGMDVVRTNTEKLGGHVEVETKPGLGTSVRLRLPLTLAIIPSMVVGVEGQRFAIPQVNVVEFVWVRAADVRNRIEQVQGALVLRLRDKLLPLVRLADVLCLGRTFVHPETGERLPDQRAALADRRGPTADDDGRPDRRQNWHTDHNIVVLRVGNNAFGVIVDELFDIEEIVVKPLSSFCQGTKCFSGATILGDGRVIMILDAGGLATVALLRFADLQAEQKKRAEEEAERARLSASRRRSVILFEAAPEEHFAVPQDKVQRLERLLESDIQRIGEREYMPYRNEALPLVRLDRHMRVRPIPGGIEELYVIIPKSTKTGGGIPAAGILITTILDAVDVDAELKPAEIAGVGLLGTAMVNNHLTLFLDPDALIAEASVAS